MFSFYVQYQSQSEDVSTFMFHCSQSQYLHQNPRKTSEVEKQRDRTTMTRFECNGQLKLKIDSNSKTVILELNHDILHPRPEKHGVTQEVKDIIRQQLHLAPKDVFASLEANYPNLTQKQVHYWWTNQIQQQYRRDNDQLVSAKILLEEAGLNIILYNYSSGIKHIGFLTTFFNSLKNNNEIIIDATCKLNRIAIINY